MEEELRKKGNELFKQSKYEEALEIYKAAKQNREILHNISISYIKLQKFQEAIDTCTKILEQDSFSVKALFRRGAAYQELGKLDLAKQDFESILVIQHYPDAINRLEIIKNQELRAKQKESKMFKGIFDKMELYQDKKVAGTSKFWYYVFAFYVLFMGLIVWFFLK